MTTTRTRSTKGPKASTPKASARGGTPPPRLVTTPRKKKPAPEERASEMFVAITTTEHIRVRAYYLSLERDGLAADPIGDWLRAELEMVTRSTEP